MQLERNVYVLSQCTSNTGYHMTREWCSNKDLILWIPAGASCSASSKQQMYTMSLW